MLEEVTGATIVWKGQTYPCTGGAEARGKKLDMGGFQLHSDCPIVVRLAVFGNEGVPVPKQTVIFTSGPEVDGKTWRIDEARTVLGAALALECNDPTQ